MSIFLQFPIQSSILKPSFFNPLSLTTKLSTLSICPKPQPRKTLIIRMGGGPRTYPGGVSKWQWKRMQAKKAKQLLKARLCRERQIYEMRKRAELKAAVYELERPWEVVETAPTLFSVKADEQVKVLADRFQKAGGFDMWSEKDGPRLFEDVGEEGLLPSTRFFPKGVVHSIKPYAKFEDSDNGLFGSGNVEGRIESGNGLRRRRRKRELKGDVGGGDVGVSGGEENSDGGSSSLKLPVTSIESKSSGDSGFRADRKAYGRRKDISLRENGMGLEQNGSGSRMRERSEKKGVGRELREQRGRLEQSGNRREQNGAGREMARGSDQNSGRRERRGQWEQLGDENDQRRWAEKNGIGRSEKIGVVREWRGRSEQMGAGRGQRGQSEKTVIGREQGEQRHVTSNGQNDFQKSYGSRKSMGSNSDVYDMSLQQDGRYGF